MELQTTISEQDSKINELKAQLDTSTHHVFALEKQLEDLEEEKQELQQKYEDLQEKNHLAIVE